MPVRDRDEAVDEVGDAMVHELQDVLHRAARPDPTRHALRSVRPQDYAQPHHREQHPLPSWSPPRPPALAPPAPPTPAAPPELCAAAQEMLARYEAAAQGHECAAEEAEQRLRREADGHRNMAARWRKLGQREAAAIQHMHDQAAATLETLADLQQKLAAKFVDPTDWSAETAADTGER